MNLQQEETNYFYALPGEARWAMSPEPGKRTRISRVQLGLPGCRCQRQAEPEGGPSARLALQAYLATLTLDELLAEVEA